ncbi:MAG: glycosyltransferase family 87 protein, partial [Hyphomicrobium sp.]|nr:glycosyltransferase family 87 protein [Hyphomicrobium sp.]
MSGSYSKALLLGSLVAIPPGISITATYFWPDSNLMEPQGFYFGRDFLNYWTGGRLALLGQADIAYDLARYNGQLRDWFSPAQSGMAFSYPPHALPLLAVFATLPYITAYVAWCLAGGAGFFAVALGRKPARDDTIVLAAIALAPILWVNFVFGQIGLLLAGLFVGALRALPTRPVLAGVLMGVLTIKPQLGLLLPLVLLLTGAWRAIATAVATALAMVALSVALFGLEPWQLYVAETMPLQWAFVAGMNGFYVNQMITPYTAFWSLGVPVDVALILQAVVSCAILLTTFLTLRSGASWALKSATV